MTPAESTNRALQIIDAALHQPPIPPGPEHAKQTHRLLDHIAQLMHDNRALRRLIEQHQEEIAALNVYASVLEDQLEDYQAREASQRWTP